MFCGQTGKETGFDKNGSVFNFSWKKYCWQRKKVTLGIDVIKHAVILQVFFVVNTILIDLEKEKLQTVEYADDCLPLPKVCRIMEP